jgi:DNA modification methylase
VKPYYQDELITLYVGDCLKIPAWANADVLITDPPYGVGGNLTTTSAVQEWDKTLAVRDAALEMFLSGGARGDELDRPYAMFASPRRLDAAVPYRQTPLVWDKGEGVGMGDTRFPWRPSYELIYVSGSGWSGHRSSAVLRVPLASNAATKAGHPTPKPVALMRMLIEKAPGGVIADPFAGTGSTLVAAKELGRTAVGVELDPTYAALAADRLAQDALDLGGI